MLEKAMDRGAGRGEVLGLRHLGPQVMTEGKPLVPPSHEEAQPAHAFLGREPLLQLIHEKAKRAMVFSAFFDGSARRSLPLASGRRSETKRLAELPEDPGPGRRRPG